MLRDSPVTRYHRLQHCAPAVGTMYVVRSQRTPLDIAELVEHEQRVIAGAGEMAIIGAAFLLAVSRAFARTRIHQMDWAGRTEDRGNAGETAGSFFHPSGPSEFGYLIQLKSLI